jgi:hypothetical protein
MADRFQISPVRLRPHAGGAVSIESGEQRVEISSAEADAAEESPVQRPPLPPPWEVLMISGGEARAKVSRRTQGSPKEESAALRDWVKQQGPAEKLRVKVRATSLKVDELTSLVMVSRELNIPIDIHLEEDD